MKVVIVTEEKSNKTFKGEDRMRELQNRRHACGKGPKGQGRRFEGRHNQGPRFNSEQRLVWNERRIGLLRDLKGQVLASNLSEESKEFAYKVIRKEIKRFKNNERPTHPMVRMSDREMSLPGIITRLDIKKARLAFVIDEVVTSDLDRDAKRRLVSLLSRKIDRFSMKITMIERRMDRMNDMLTVREDVPNEFDTAKDILVAIANVDKQIRDIETSQLKELKEKRRQLRRNISNLVR